MRTKFERNPDLFTLPISSAKFHKNSSYEAPKLLKVFSEQVQKRVVRVATINKNVFKMLFQYIWVDVKNLR